VDSCGKKAAKRLDNANPSVSEGIFAGWRLEKNQAIADIKNTRLFRRVFFSF
jgi:hypothetical protein